MSLRASLSEKEDISSGGFSERFSKPRKGALLQYTTRSDSSGLSFELTWKGQTARGTENWYITLKKKNLDQASLELLLCLHSGAAAFGGPGYDIISQHMQPWKDAAPALRQDSPLQDPSWACS